MKKIIGATIALSLLTTHANANAFINFFKNYGKHAKRNLDPKTNGLTDLNKKTNKWFEHDVKDTLDPEKNGLNDYIKDLGNMIDDSATKTGKQLDKAFNPDKNGVGDWADKWDALNKASK